MDRRTVLVYSHNGSIEEVEEDLLSPTASGVIIVFCLLLGVCYNLFVIGAVGTSTKLRNSPFHVGLLMLCLVSLLDCITNETFAFGFLFDFNPKVCNVSAMTFHLFLLTHSAALSLLFLERALELHERSFTFKTFLWGVLTTWIFGLMFTTTLIASLDAHFFPNRYACSFVKSSLWPSTVYFMGFCTSWAVTTTSFFLCVRSIRSHNEDQHLTILSVLPTLTDADIPNPLQHLMSSNRNNLSFTIMFIYVFLIFPEAISVILNLFLTPIFEPDPWLDPRVKGYVRSVTTNSLEPLFVYSRFVYNAVVPIIILVNDKDSRTQSRKVFCCRWNEVSSLGISERIIPAGFEEYDQTTIINTTYDLRTPVLYATPDGLHLRVPQRNEISVDSERSIMEETNLKLGKTHCDVTISSCIERGEASTVTKSSTCMQTGENSKMNILEVDRNVRFSSKVQEILLESGVWSSSGQGSSLSATHTVNIPLFVKSGHDSSSELQ